MREELIEIENLIFQYLKGDLSRDEEIKLQEWIDLSDKNMELFNSLTDKAGLEEKLKVFHQMETNGKEEARLKTMKRLFPEGKVMPMHRARIWNKWIAASAVIILVCATGYFLAVNKKDPKVEIVQQPTFDKWDVQPGGNGAILTLADGKQIVLDSTQGSLIAQGNAELVNQNGRLSYTRQSDPAHIVYNTMTTPKGRQYQLMLADGSSVWLNAASSITYPTVFTGNERKVEITGEVYFEVAKDAKKPFRVDIGNETIIEVLGTHFNVNAYKEEPQTNTTLLEGSVLIKTARTSIKLTPGQQGQLDVASKNLSLAVHPEVDKAIAWKNGFFSFKDADLKTIMRQLSRWYDIDVRYEGTDYKETFSGKIGRNLTLRDLLDGLAKTRVHYRIEEEKRLVILPETVK